jgi:hypothetical protein
MNSRLFLVCVEARARDRFTAKERTTRRWSTIWQVAACVPTTCRWPVITPRVVRPVRPISATSRAKTMPAATACYRPLPNTTPTCSPNAGSCVRRTAPRCGSRSESPSLRGARPEGLVVLAAGALVAPVLLLNSVPASGRADWPTVRSANWANGLVHAGSRSERPAAR